MRPAVRIAALAVVLTAALTPGTAAAAHSATALAADPVGTDRIDIDARHGDVAALVVDEEGRPTIVRVYAATVTEARRKAAAVPGSDGVVVDVPVLASASAPAQPVTAAAVGADPGRARQWHLDRLHMDDIPVPAVTATPTATATVAVLDTGVLAHHEDFAPGQVLCSRGVDLTGEALSTDGCVDPDGHGTHVAGIIGAVANNALGVAGVAAGIRILPVRVLGADGSGSSFATVEGITYAVDHGATVINLSLGGVQGAGIYDAAVAYARSKGVQVIASAGNNRQGGNAVGYPAATPGVTSVAATDSTDTSASFSYSGPSVDIAAPGVNIYSLGNTPSRYVGMSGTSMAAPVVAAVAALHRAASPASTEAEATAALLRTADDIEAPGRDNNTGAGLVDPYELLTGAPRPRPAPPAGPPTGLRQHADDERQVWLTWTNTPSTPAAPVHSYRVYRDGRRIALYTSIGRDTTWALDENLQPGTRYTYTVSAAGEGGESAPTSPLVVTTRTPPPSTPPPAVPAAPPVSAPAPAPAPGPVLLPAPPPAAPALPPAPAPAAPTPPAPTPPAAGLPAAGPAPGVPAPQPAAPVRTPSASAAPVAAAPAATARLLAMSIRRKQHLAITVTDYRPGSTVQVTETYPVFTRSRTAGKVVTRTVSRTVVLATLRVPASGTLNASVLPVQTARTGRLAVTGTDRRGVRTGLSATIRVG